MDMECGAIRWDITKGSCPSGTGLTAGATQMVGGDASGQDRGEGAVMMIASCTHSTVGVDLDDDRVVPYCMKAVGKA